MGGVGGATAAIAAAAIAAVVSTTIHAALGVSASAARSPARTSRAHIGLAAALSAVEGLSQRSAMRSNVGG